MQRLYSLIYIAYLFSASVTASEDVNNFVTCGEYQAIGKLLLKTNDEPLLVLYENTRIETKLKIVNPTKTMLNSYANSKVEIIGRISRKLNSRNGFIELYAIKELLPNPMDPENESQLNLRKKVKCN